MDHRSVYRRCGCRDTNTRRLLLGARCPGLRSPEHGTWYFSTGLPSAAGERRRVRRGGFATKAPPIPQPRHLKEGKAQDSGRLTRPGR
jgi:hypothetical protein